MSDLAVPYLKAGMGSTPADGGCIMQVIDWLHRNMWTDNPPCVHPLLRSIAIAANDGAPEEDRQKLLGLAPRLMHTNDRTLDTALVEFVECYVEKVFAGLRVVPVMDYAAEENATNSFRMMENAVRKFRSEGFDAYWNWLGSIGLYAWSALFFKGHAPLALLTAVLDEYDRLSGRKEVEQIDFAPVCKAMAAV